MQEYYFANYRLLIDDAIATQESMQYLSAFREVLPYEHTFTLRLGNPDLLEEKYTKALSSPVVGETSGYEMHPTEEGWMFISKPVTEDGHERAKTLLECSRDYSEMTLFMLTAKTHLERFGAEISILHIFKTMVRITCGAGMAFKDGLSLHASMVEKDGYAVLFVGPSGMGKSTQARLWQQYQDAEIINGDSPTIYEKDGEWFAAGIPWDGKDQIFKQRNLPIKAVIVLQQAKENKIEKLSPMKAMATLLQLVMHPYWDDKAMDCVTNLIGRCAHKVAFYHLQNLPNEEATVLTHHTINK